MHFNSVKHIKEANQTAGGETSYYSGMEDVSR